MGIRGELIRKYIQGDCKYSWNMAEQTAASEGELLQLTEQWLSLLTFLVFDLLVQL